ncbi:multiple sugar transport system substrate-binding protein [Rhizobium viscosum]|uniref:Multiple sugar transport system substrate-binding protein n=2 Tax=Rhizobium viscosum TaxID=1673 RepID=A0ABR9IY16_RHIVS|nr:multiple sugar transport system substrate-binding protein [Rhizobium viscosum]
MPKTAYRLAAAVMALMATTAYTQAKSLDGVTLTIASMNDGFSKVLTELAPAFKEETGADIKVEIMDYGTLLTKTTADFVGDTKGYDLVTMDIVWAGAYAENKYSVDLTDWVKRDAAELDLDDIYPVALKSLGQYDDHYVAFPFAAYANVLAYRKDLLEAAGLKPPASMEELVADAKKLTDPSKKQYGFVANGQKGPAVAQDWMQYNNQLGGSILDKDGKPALNSEANIKSLTVYKELFTVAAPPGAIEYDWGGREESFRQGMSAFMQTWSVGAAAYSDPKVSNIVGKAGIAVAPVAAGMTPQYGVGGWGLAINADIDTPKQEAAWTFIKWVTSKKIHKEFNMLGAGGFMRKSEMTDPDLLAKYDFLPVIAQTYENGNGEFRPRIPEYPEIQDMLGTAVNSVLAGAATPKEALDKAQEAAEKLF